MRAVGLLTMPDVLFIKTSSLGDVIHHMPALMEARRQRPAARFLLGGGGRRSRRSANSSGRLGRHPGRIAPLARYAAFARDLARDRKASGAPCARAATTISSTHRGSCAPRSWRGSPAAAGHGYDAKQHP